MLPPAIPRARKRDTRWRSSAHTSFVRSRACAVCGATAGLEAAHVRMGSAAGVSQKPDDYRTVGLCRDCHHRQHQVGERTFWQGRDVEALIRAYIAASPKRVEIERVQRERGA